jgi:hypothetical protein
VAGPPDQVGQVGDHRVTGEPPAGQSQVGGGRPVERAEAAQAGGAEPDGAAPGLGHDAAQLGPRRIALPEESV